MGRFDSGDDGKSTLLLPSGPLVNMVRYRAEAVGQYAQQLVRANPSAPASYYKALGLVERFALATGLEAQSTAQDDQSSERQKRLRMARRLRVFGERERLIDHVFARTGQIEVPLSLRSVVDSELRQVGRLAQRAGRPNLTDRAAINNALGVPSTEEEASDEVRSRRVSAILAVGEPSRFDFWTADLEDELFQDIVVLPPEGDRNWDNSGEQFVVLTVPYLEGTRTLWQPIVVGHELGHLRIGAANRAGYLLTLVKDLQAQLPVEVQEVTELSLLSRWIEEILCDLNAVKMYGPAGLAAVAEMLYVVGPHYGTWFGSEDHPPISLRAMAMLAYLEYQADGGRISPITVPFQSLATDGWQSVTLDELREQSRGLTARIAHGDLPQHEQDRATYQITAGAVALLLDSIVGEASGSPVLGPQYAYGERWGVIQQIADAFRVGLPCEPSLPGPDGELTRLSHADVVNGAWLSYLVPAPDDAHLRRHGVDIPFDRLATFSAESLEFHSLMYPDGATGDRVRLEQLNSLANGPMYRHGPVQSEAPHAAGQGSASSNGDQERGVLSGRAIALRLASSVFQSRLVVSPLMVEEVREAGLDLRLGTRFITFRRTATAVVDPLGDPLKWRAMEEVVQEPWGGRFILHPGELVLAATLEYLVLPDDLTAQVLTRSSYGRLGLITATAVQVQPATWGCLTLELVNHGRAPIALVPGHRIAQLILTSVDSAVDQSDGLFDPKYHFATGPESSSLYRDLEIPRLAGIRSAWG